jgi:hypothetical protein
MHQIKTSSQDSVPNLATLRLKTTKIILVHRPPTDNSNLVNLRTPTFRMDRVSPTNQIILRIILEVSLKTNKTMAILPRKSHPKLIHSVVIKVLLTVIPTKVLLLRATHTQNHLCINHLNHKANLEIKGTSSQRHLKTATKII